MALLRYFECGFHYFSRDLAIEWLQDYARRLDDVFNQNQTMGFSADRFVKMFHHLPEHFNPHSNWAYRFEFNSAGENEIWEIKWRITQIPHFEGGIVRASPKSGNRLPFAHSLIEHRVANTVEVGEYVEAKGIRRLLGKDFSGTLVGEVVQLYLWQRLRRIRPLHMKLCWEPRNANGFDFYGFADRVADALGSAPAEVVELNYTPETDDVPAFMHQCDERLKSQLDNEELIALFELIELTPNEWFGSAEKIGLL